MSNLTDEEVLEAQIRQVREALATIENQQSGSTGVESEEMWAVMKQNLDENTPVHPRIKNIFTGHFQQSEVEKTLMRLENDLSDLRNVTESEELYDPMEHDIDHEDEQNGPNVNNPEGAGEDDSGNPTQVRDKEQRPLSAYQNSGS